MTKNQRKYLLNCKNIESILTSLSWQWKNIKFYEWGGCGLI